MRSVHTREHRSSIKRKKIQILHHRYTMKMLLEVKDAKTQKAPYCSIPFTCDVQTRSTTETERRLVAARAWGPWRVQKIFWDWSMVMAVYSCELHTSKW